MAAQGSGHSFHTLTDVGASPWLLGDSQVETRTAVEKPSNEGMSMAYTATSFVRRSPSSSPLALLPLPPKFSPKAVEMLDKTSVAWSEVPQVKFW